MPGDKPSLEALQRWMQQVITHPGGVAAGLAAPATRRELDVPPGEVAAVILPSRQLTSDERLGVYANAYYARLLECMRSFFPVLTRTLGEELFDQFAFDYLQAYPPHSYTLARLADHFVEYLEKSRPAELATGGATGSGEEPGWPEFLVDLARVELAIDEVFDGPGIEGTGATGSGLDPAEISAIAPADWPAARLVPSPSLRLLTLRFPLHDYYTAVRRGGTLPPMSAPAESYLALSRLEYVVRRYPLSRPQYLLLSRLAAGDSVGGAIEVVAAEEEDWEALAANLSSWFSRWTAGGFFAGVELGE